MKDNWEDGGIYWTQHPLKQNLITLAKAKDIGDGRCLYFFSCDCTLCIRWNDVVVAYRMSFEKRVQYERVS